MIIKLKNIYFIALISIFTFSIQSCDKEESKPIITIGDFYKGGVVFYIDSTGEHGLVCAVSDQSFEASWGCTPLVVNGANGLEIGTGIQNTIDIITTCDDTSNAAWLCHQLVLNDYDDWFLPSKDELNMLYQNREIVNETAKANGGNQLEDTEYWTSSHQNSNTVWGQNFNAGNQSGFGENELFNVRAIRTF